MPGQWLAAIDVSDVLVWGGVIALGASFLVAVVREFLDDPANFLYWVFLIAALIGSAYGIAWLFHNDVLKW